MRMKKTIALLFVLLISIATVRSQITKGYWMMGGNISYTSSKNNSELSGGSESFSFRTQTNAGYFIWNKFAGGVQVNIDSYGGRISSSATTNLHIGPYARYYFLKQDKIVNIITEAGYLFGFDKSTGNPRHPTQILHVACGPVVFFNPSVALELLLSYSAYTRQTYERPNALRFSLGVQVHLGNNNE